MKFERRSEGPEDPTPAQQPETARTGKKPVVVYIMILFIVAFLLMALSFFMHQRSNTEVLGELQHSVSAMQEIQSAQEKIIELQEDLADAQDTIDEMETQFQESESALEAVQQENQALLSLYALQQQYSAGDLDACRAIIQQMESAGLDGLLPEEDEQGVTPPAQRFQQLKNAVEAQEN